MGNNFSLAETGLSDYKETDLYKQLNLLLHGQQADSKEHGTIPNGEQAVDDRCLQVIEQPIPNNFCFKKLCKLTHSSDSRSTCCYVPEQNLLFELNDEKTVRVFDTIMFKHIYTKTFENSIYTVRYSEDCKRVFFAGEDFYIEVYNPENRKTEGTSNVISQGDHIDEVVYLKENDTIAVGTRNRNVHILSKDLNILFKFKISVFRDEPIKDIINLENGFLLVTRAFFNKKRISLCNLSTKRVSEFPDIEVSGCSSIGVLKDGPRTIITCAASIPDRQAEKFRLIQITQEAGTENLVVSKIGPSNKEFLDFKKIGNSKYYIAKFRERVNLKTVIMEVFANKVVIVHTTSGGDYRTHGTNQFALIKDDLSLLIGSDSSQDLCIYNTK